MDSEREVLSLEPIADHPEVGRWLSAMEDARRDTLNELDGVSDAMLDLTPADANSIGTLLYHIALVEADWLHSDILGPEAAPAWPTDVFPYGDREADGRLTNVDGIALDGHLTRLRETRALVMRYLIPMPAEEFHRRRPRERYDVSPAWVLHHLLQHEAEHRAHIAWVRDTVRDLRGGT